MVEGHACHRLAHKHRQLLLNKKFKATSPNGRFTDGALAINNRILTRIEVHGKNLFYFFGTNNKDDTSTSTSTSTSKNQVVLYFHFGMAGAFGVFGPGTHATTPTTRLELLNEAEGIVAHLSAMIVQHGDLDFYQSKIARLGEDPLRDNADPEIVWTKIKRSKSPIGSLVMNQSIVAGVGNIYRAEILFKSRVHPEQPGNTISRSTFDIIWHHSVSLLRRGFETGSILTVDPEEAAVLGQPWTQRYVYNHTTCGRCNTPVLSWPMGNQKIYCCTTCQPLENADEMSTARMKVMAQGHQAIEFVSHCAPDDVNDSSTPLSKLTVAALRKRITEATELLETSVLFSETQLKSMKKSELVELLQAFENNKSVTTIKDEEEEAEGEVVAVATPLPGNDKRKKFSTTSSVSPRDLSIKKKLAL
jgi:formamidopyrimidine-DNA glycosylase